MVNEAMGIQIMKKRKSQGLRNSKQSKVTGMNKLGLENFKLEDVKTNHRENEVKAIPNYERFELIGKFQSSPQKPSSNTTGKIGTTSTNKINYPIRQIGTQVPECKKQDLKNIYNQIETKKYSTSAIDPSRNYLTVFEYNINNQNITWDYETGFIHLPGIWKAASGTDENPARNIKDIIGKLLDSTPKELNQNVKRIRGGFLKIQGTWLPYDLCRKLARRFSYPIRYELIPVFGESFPDECTFEDNSTSHHPDVDSSSRLLETNLSSGNPVARPSRVTGETSQGSILHLKNKKAFQATIDTENVSVKAMATQQRMNSSLCHNSLQEFSIQRNHNEPWRNPNQYVASTGPNIQKRESTKYLQREMDRSYFSELEKELNLNEIGSKTMPSCNYSVRDRPDLPISSESADVFNASRCLQNLRDMPVSLPRYSGPFHSDRDIYSNPQKQIINERNSGISSILIAAGISDFPNTAGSSRMNIDYLLT